MIEYRRFQCHLCISINQCDYVFTLHFLYSCRGFSYINGSLRNQENLFLLDLFFLPLSTQRYSERIEKRYTERTNTIPIDIHYVLLDCTILFIYY